MVETKVCSKCQEEKPIKFFFKINRNTVKRRRICKDCANKYRRIRSHNNYKLWINEILPSIRPIKCEICGYSKSIAALDFHHKDPSIKEARIRQLLWAYNPYTSTKINVEKVKKEINKCQILCSNCHRELHEKERQDA